jgi:hypothetical protein
MKNQFKKHGSDQAQFTTGNVANGKKNVTQFPLGRRLA